MIIKRGSFGGRFVGKLGETGNQGVSIVGIDGVAMLDRLRRDW